MHSYQVHLFPFVLKNVLGSHFFPCVCTKRANAETESEPDDLATTKVPFHEGAPFHSV